VLESTSPNRASGLNAVRFVTANRGRRAVADRSDTMGKVCDDPTGPRRRSIETPEPSLCFVRYCGLLHARRERRNVSDRSPTPRQEISQTPELLFEHLLLVFGIHLPVLVDRD
jgi:hypothetical protein